MAMRRESEASERGSVPVRCGGAGLGEIWGDMGRYGDMMRWTRAPRALNMPREARRDAAFVSVLRYILAMSLGECGIVLVMILGAAGLRAGCLAG